ncbi:MAG: ATPase, T2SS/T4P/T4SS family, partial [Candidatus ainarchaeum sp.]|nr:ATPase, T2SS/T4P/T4SS family [Candidatus ainarchaeum sp.]
DLIKESFRQRPDYLIIGEVRGEEISLMFQGMASGHCCLSTLHARSLNDLVNRLITPPISLEPSLLTSLDVVIVGGFSGGSETKRTIKEIDEVRGFNVKDNKIEYNAVYNYSEKPKVKDSGDLFTSDLPITYKSEILKDISKEYNININTLLQIINNRIKFIDDLTKKHPKDYVEFKLAINRYKATEKELNELNG